MSCTTAPPQRLHLLREERRRRKNGLCCISTARFNLCSEHRRAALSDAFDWFLNGWLKKATIDPYNSKIRAQVIQSRTSWHSMLKQKKKSEPGGSLIKHLLDVTQKRKTRNRRGCTKQRRKTILIKILFCRIPTKNFYLVLSSAS